MVLYKDEGPLRGQVPTGHVLATQELQVSGCETIKDHLRPPELYHLQDKALLKFSILSSELSSVLTHDLAQVHSFRVAYASPLEQ